MEFEGSPLPSRPPTPERQKKEKEHREQERSRGRRREKRVLSSLQGQCRALRMPVPRSHETMTRASIKSPTLNQPSPQDPRKPTT